MIFPFSNRNALRDPFDPAHQIDREVADRCRRLAVGLSLESDLQNVTGALIVTEGKGRHLHIIRATTCRRRLPDIATGLLHKLTTENDPSWLDIKAVQSDIAIAQIELVDELKRHAGKYVDRLLIVATSDPGLWIGDGDTVSGYIPICDPNVVADATGISVIDAFPIRDMAAGGNGRYLDPMPAWMLLADRSKKLASRNRILFSINETACAWYLPASDGLDVDIPEIRFATCDGLNRFRWLQKQDADESMASEIQRLNVQGRFDPNIDDRLDLERLTQLAAKKSISLPDCVRTTVVRIVTEISDRISSLIGDPSISPDVLIECLPELSGSLVNQFRRRWPEAQAIDRCVDGCNLGSLRPILTATLGVMGVDQLPANIPRITGARAQRILGRFTPGAPSNWRQLLKEMADFQPPAMRLRDAV